MNTNNNSIMPITFKVKFVDVETKGKYVEYTVKVLASNGMGFHTKDRYKNMRDFYDELRKEGPFNSKIPDFPPKKWFGNMDGEFIQQRQRGLEHFFNGLLGREEFAALGLVRKYLKNTSTDPTEADNTFKVQIPINNDDKPSSSRPIPQEETKIAPISAMRRSADSLCSINDQIDNKCNEIVEKTAEKYIDLNFCANSGIVLGDHAIRKDKLIKELENIKLEYDSQLFDLPKGNSKNIDLLERYQQGGEEGRNAKVTELVQKLSGSLREIHETLNGKDVIEAERIIVNFN